MKTVDYKFHELCDEIDYWKSQYEKQKEDTEYWRNLYQEQINRRTEETNQGIAQALMLALSVEDNEDGSLSISKENREKLAEQFKTDEECTQ